MERLFSQKWFIHKPFQSEGVKCQGVKNVSREHIHHFNGDSPENKVDIFRVDTQFCCQELHIIFWFSILLIEIFRIYALHLYGLPFHQYWIWNFDRLPEVQSGCARQGHATITIKTKENNFFFKKMEQH